MSNEHKPHRVIMAFDGSYALICEDLPLDSSSAETVTNLHYEIGASAFIPVPISPRDYDLAVTHSPYGLKQIEETAEDLKDAVKKVRYAFERYAENPTDMGDEQKRRFEEEYKNSRKKVEELGKKKYRV